MTTPAFLSVETLSHRYGERKALDALSFSVQQGEIFGLLGPNGSGKTTLFRLLSTLLPLQDGTVTLDGISLRYDLAGIRQHLGVVFQSPSLDKKLTVAENLQHQGHLYGLYGPALAKRIRELAEKFKIADRLKDKVETLSGGLQRRVEVAKGLLHRPSLLILDEPTTGLDPAARLELWSYLREVNQFEKITILLTTHLMDEAERCHRLMILDRGLRVCLDTPAALRSVLKGSVITIQSSAAASIQQKLDSTLGLKAQVMQGALVVETPDSPDLRTTQPAHTLRIEVPSGSAEQGPKLVAQIVSTFPDVIESITLSQPTLEDVFIHLTGRRFEN